MPSADTQAPAPTPDGMPSSGVRGVITYLIFLHFFFLLVGIKSRTDSSGLEQDLRNKVPGLRPYLQLLGMDLSYMFHLTYYDPSPEATYPLTDTDFFVEADIPQPDGSTKLVVLPNRDDLHGQRFRRLERLMHVTGMEGENQNDAAGVLAEGIARRIIVENNCIELAQATPVKLRFRRRLLPNYMMTPQDLERTGILKVERDAPGNFQTVYQVLASVTKDKAVVVTRVGEASNAAAPGAAAPVVPGAAAPAGGTP